MATIEENQTYTEPDNHEARNNVGQVLPETSHLMAPSSADGGRDGRIALRKARIEAARILKSRPSNNEGMIDSLSFKTVKN